MAVYVEYVDFVTLCVIYTVAGEGVVTTMWIKHTVI